jgi:hypothetical protein
MRRWKVVVNGGLVESRDRRCWRFEQLTDEGCASSEVFMKSAGEP